MTGEVANGWSGRVARCYRLPIATLAPRASLTRLPRDPSLLRPLIDEESGTWAKELSWDYAEVGRALLTGLENGSVRAFGIDEGGRVVAYGYYLVDGRRAVIGSLFSSSSHRGRGYEAALADALIADARTGSFSRRIECQTLFVSDPEVDERFAARDFASRERHYLCRALEAPVDVPATKTSLRTLRLGDLSVAATVIHASHVGSVDAAMNTTYKTEADCRSFLETLMLRSGCGTFDPEASVVAEGTRGPIGILLASRLSSDNGHICQVSVLPEAQSSGLGRTLVCRALEAFRTRGLRQATLSVTMANMPAYGLYRSLGFAPRRMFHAHAWVAPPERIHLGGV